jgi:NAD(P) transhydrogenase subunit alpha
VVKKLGVTIIGYTDLPSRLSKQSSQLYGTNLFRFLEELCPKKDGVIVHNMNDEVIRGATVTSAGEITWPPPVVAVSAQPVAAAPQPAIKSSGHKKTESEKPNIFVFIVAALALLLVGLYAPAVFVTQITVFILACLIGYMVVWNVTASLHTPLMSVTNAISSIIIVGALLQISSDDIWIQILSTVAVVLTSINLFGGFAVTQRMLNMFKKGS